MAAPVLVAADPLAVPAKIYDKIWVEELVVSAPDPNQDASARVRLRKFAVVNGVAELEPGAGTWLTINNVLSGAETDPDLGQAVAALMAFITKTGQAEGVVAADPSLPEPVIIDPAGGDPVIIEPEVVDPPDVAP
jgi:hypothetical protein